MMLMRAIEAWTSKRKNERRTIKWHVAIRPGKRPALDKRLRLGAVVDALERAKARYRELRKNGQQLLTLFAMANLVLARRWLLEGLGAPAVWSRGAKALARGQPNQWMGHTAPKSSVTVAAGLPIVSATLKCCIV